MEWRILKASKQAGSESHASKQASPAGPDGGQDTALVPARGFSTMPETSATHRSANSSGRVGGVAVSDDGTC